MSTHNDGGPAFPSAWQNEGDQGMTLRDYFAAHAMAALIAEPVYEGGSSMLWRVSGGHTFDGLEEERAAAAAYKLADAMLAERNKRGSA